MCSLYARIIQFGQALDRTGFRFSKVDSDDDARARLILTMTPGLDSCFPKVDSDDDARAIDRLDSCFPKVDSDDDARASP